MGLEKNGSFSSDGRACLSWRSVPQLLCSPTRCGKSGPGKRIDLQDVVQELDQLVGAGANLLDRVGLLDGVEIVAHVVDAAAGGRHDVIEAGEIAHEQRLGVGASALNPLFAIGWPQHVWSRGYTTSWPNRSSSSRVAMPTSGKKASM